jgi:hypothetical protein
MIPLRLTMYSDRAPSVWSAKHLPSPVGLSFPYLTTDSGLVAAVYATQLQMRFFDPAEPFRQKGRERGLELDT